MSQGPRVEKGNFVLAQWWNFARCGLSRCLVVDICAKQQRSIIEEHDRNRRNVVHVTFKLTEMKRHEKARIKSKPKNLTQLRQCLPGNERYKHSPVRKWRIRKIHPPTSPCRPSGCHADVWCCQVRKRNGRWQHETPTFLKTSNKKGLFVWIHQFRSLGRQYGRLVD